MTVIPSFTANRRFFTVFYRGVFTVNYRHFTVITVFSAIYRHLPSFTAIYRHILTPRITVMSFKTVNDGKWR